MVGINRFPEFFRAGGCGGGGIMPDDKDDDFRITEADTDT